MQALKLLALFVGTALSGAMSSHAQWVSFDIPNPLMIFHSGTGPITVSKSLPAMEALDQITVSLAHEWLGDLRVTLVPPSGPAFTLFDRVGVTPTVPEGSSAVLGVFVPQAEPGVPFQLIAQPYTFARSGLDFGAAAEASVLNLNPPAVPSADGVYGAQDWVSGPFPAGQWTIAIADFDDVSDGSLASAELLSSVPEPGQAAVLVASLLLTAALSRRLFSESVDN